MVSPKIILSHSSTCSINLRGPFTEVFVMGMYHSGTNALIRELQHYFNVPVYPNDNVETLLTRTYDHQLCLFYEITHYLYTGKLLPKSDEEWTRAPIQRNDFNELTKIQIDMDKNEINKRIRATMFKDFRPELSLNGFIFELKNDGSK